MNVCREDDACHTWLMAESERIERDTSGAYGDVVGPSPPFNRQSFCCARVPSFDAAGEAVPGLNYSTRDRCEEGIARALLVSG